MTNTLMTGITPINTIRKNLFLVICLILVD
jgi:hypothetical protein